MSNKLKRKRNWFENGPLELKAMTDPYRYGNEKITKEFVEEQVEKMDSFIDEIKRVKGIEVEKKEENMAEKFYNSNQDMTNMQCIFTFSLMREKIYKG